MGCPGRSRSGSGSAPVPVLGWDPLSCARRFGPPRSRAARQPVTRSEVASGPRTCPAPSPTAPQPRGSRDARAAPGRGDRGGGAPGPSAGRGPAVGRPRSSGSAPRPPGRLHPSGRAGRAAVRSMLPRSWLSTRAPATSRPGPPGAGSRARAEGAAWGQVSISAPSAFVFAGLELPALQGLSGPL